ncbi:MAG: DUF4395 domain-containing protein [Ilumatobacteraceae bacterium]
MALTLETPTRTGLFSFPNPVNETSARLVALGAVAQSILFLVVREWWVLVPLTYGFVARVLTGPTLSPWGTIVTRFITPRITREHRFVPGPPKRFAQGIGAVFTVGASVAWALGAPTVSYVLIAGLTFAAGLEAFAGFCLGCVMFARLMKWGVIPAEICEECNDISKRLARPITH